MQGSATGFSGALHSETRRRVRALCALPGFLATDAAHGTRKRIQARPRNGPAAIAANAEGVLCNATACLFEHGDFTQVAFHYGDLGGEREVRHCRVIGFLEMIGKLQGGRMFGIAQRRGDFAAQLADAALDAIRQRRALFVG
jgi:hypothetical protein